MVVKVQENKSIINKSIYLALGIGTDGNKELLGMWISQNKGAKFWLSVLIVTPDVKMHHLNSNC